MSDAKRGLLLAAILTVAGWITGCATADRAQLPSNQQELANAFDLNAPNSVQPGHAGTNPTGTGNTGPRSSGSNSYPGPSPVPDVIVPPR